MQQDNLSMGLLDIAPGTLRQMVELPARTRVVSKKTRYRCQGCQFKINGSCCWINIEAQTFALGSN